jgi:hypothetical protein
MMRRILIMMMGMMMMRTRRRRIEMSLTSMVMMRTFLLQ